MITMLTDLMHHLQDVNTHHPGDGTPVLVAVPTTPRALELFEVQEVHRHGPAVVLHCQLLQDEPAPPEPAPPPVARTRRRVYNDYLDLL